MQSNDTTPRFRNLSINGTTNLLTSSFSIYDKSPEEHRDPEKECFMCRQANVYIKPIGMQQERRVARHHPPPLTRAQIEELSEKKHLTKREVRLLLQCYFPEIKNVKYFQLHKFHSCCYDPKHINLCKNHITALQHQREDYSNHHLPTDEKDNGHQNRVSFVRIKIEPTKGIPTRFLGPTALPESLADMLIKQVNRYENKKKPPSFGLEPHSSHEMHKTIRSEQSYENGISRLSEHLANIDSNDEDDEDDDDDDDDSDEDDNNHINTPNSNIRGYHGKITDRSRIKYERKLQTREKKENQQQDVSTNVKNGDLVVEDVDEIIHLFVKEKQEPSEASEVNESPKPLKKKKRKRKSKSKKHIHRHPKPKLNHWEVLALDQSKQEVCGCRHHVRRLEADQVVYDWCRCKDHSHRTLKEKRKSTPPPAPPPPPPTPPPKRRPKKIKPKVEKRTIGINATEKTTTRINATEKTTTELALAYDPSTVDYDVIEEALYYRTSSGRLVKPSITNAFGYTDRSLPKGLHHRSLTKKSGPSSVTSFDEIQRVQDDEKHQRRSVATLSNVGSVSNGQTVIDTEISTNIGTDELMPVHQSTNSVSATKKVGMYDDDDDDDDDNDDDDDQEETVQFIPPKYVPEIPVGTPIQPPIIQMSMQKSSKPTYRNVNPTPNFDRESSIVVNRRWFDQPLGDQNLEGVHDGYYGLIAGTSTEQYKLNIQLPDNDYVEPEIRRNRSNCTIS